MPPAEPGDKARKMSHLRGVRPNAPAVSPRSNVTFRYAPLEVRCNVARDITDSDGSIEDKSDGIGGGEDEAEEGAGLGVVDDDPAAVG